MNLIRSRRIRIPITLIIRSILRSLRSKVLTVGPTIRWLPLR